MAQIPVSDFNLKDTVESGQIFRFSQHGQGYYIANGDKSFYIEQTGNPSGASSLQFDGVKESFVREFFDLDFDYSRVRRELSKFPKLLPALNKYPGIRIIKQDPWECTVGFICSQQSTIPRIKKSMQTLVDCFGDHPKFPRPDQLPDEARLKKLKFGYRAKYLAALRTMKPEFLESLKDKPYLEAKEALMTYKGIGEKIADCICLFALGHSEAFPVDTWVKQFMTESYGLKDEKAMRAFAAQKWGPLAGFAQQYFYHWRRLQ